VILPLCDVLLSKQPGHCPLEAAITSRVSIVPGLLVTQQQILSVLPAVALYQLLLTPALFAGAAVGTSLALQQALPGPIPAISPFPYTFPAYMVAK
jgi:hypothetical protein